MTIAQIYQAFNVVSVALAAGIVLYTWRNPKVDKRTKTLLYGTAAFLLLSAGFGEYVLLGAG